MASTSEELMQRRRELKDEPRMLPAMLADAIVSVQELESERDAARAGLKVHEHWHNEAIKLQGDNPGRTPSMVNAWIRNMMSGLETARAELDAIAIALEWPRQDESTTLLEEVKEAACNGVLLAEAKSKLHHVRNQRDNRAYVGCGLAEKLETARAQVERLRWRRIDGPGIDGQRVMLRELDPFDEFNRGDENRDAIASGYWSAEYGHYIWPFGCTDHPPTHWAPMPDRLTDERKEGE